MKEFSMSGLSLLSDESKKADPNELFVDWDRSLTGIGLHTLIAVVTGSSRNDDYARHTVQFSDVFNIELANLVHA